MSRIQINSAEKYELPEILATESPADYIKSNLAAIAHKFHFNVIYDSLTGYPVATIYMSEFKGLLEQIWWSELREELIQAMTGRRVATVADLAPIIEAGVDQLRIRSLATMRPTPALSFIRDLNAMERIRQIDPQRIASYLLIRFLVDNSLARNKATGLDDVLTRHEIAVQLGRICRDHPDSHEINACTRQLIELDARFNLSKIKFDSKQEQLIIGFLAMFMSPESKVEKALNESFDMLRKFVRKVLAQCEKAELYESGNRQMRPAFVEATREEIMLGINAESAKIELKASHKAKRRDAAKFDKNGKPRIRIDKSMLMLSVKSAADVFGL